MPKSTSKPTVSSASNATASPVSKVSELSKVSKYTLYEATVQNPKWQVDYLPQFHRWLTGREPRLFREDFCGSGKIACEWVKRSSRNRALGLDICPEALAHARQVNLLALPTPAQGRVQFREQNVLKPTRDKFDLIGAFNFSFFAFHDRALLLRYARSAVRSLKNKGTLFLEVSGGEGFIEPHCDQKTVQVSGVGKVRQVWEQHQFDPITEVCDYSIHFQLPSGQWLNDAFVYHWRIWGLRDIREVLEEAGFKKTVVLWPQVHGRNEAASEFLPSENAERTHSWVAYIVGVK